MSFFKKSVLILLAVLFPSIANAFPVMASTASQGAIILGGLLLGVGGVTSSKRLRVACFLLLLIVIFQGYQQQVSNESLGISQEHEYFQASEADYGNAQFVDYDEFYTRLKGDPGAKIIHLSGLYPLIYPGVHSTRSSLADVGVSPEFTGNVYALSFDVAHASQTVSKWSRAGVNVFLVPLSTSDIIKTIRSQTGNFRVNIIDLESKPDYETLAHFYSNYNVIYISDSMGMQGSTHHGSIVIYENNTPFYTDYFWTRVRSTIDPEKKTLIITKRDSLNHGLDYVNYISKKIRVTEVVYSNIPLLWDEYNSISSDNIITPGYPNQSRFLSPSELYATQDASDSLMVVCLSSGCLDYYPEHRRVLWDSKSLLSYSDQGRYLIDIPKSADHDLRYVVSPIGSEESSLAFRLGYTLVDQGYRFEGLLFHPSNYYGGTYINGDGDIEYDHSMLLSFDRFFRGLLLSIKPIDPLIKSMPALLIIGFFIGILISVGGYLRIIGAVSFIYLFLFFDDLVLLHLSHYQYFYIKPYFLASLFLIASLSSASRKNVLSIILSSIFIYIISDSMSVPADRLVGAILAIMAFFSLATIFMRAARHHDGLISPVRVGMTVGSKISQSIDWADDNACGYIINKGDIRTRFLGYFFVGKWILRSNHIAFEESFFNGYFESSVIDRKDIKAAVRQAYDKSLETLDRKKIQFWLQPYIDSDIKGVAASHVDRDPSKFIINYAGADEVTEGLECISISISRLDSSSSKWQAGLISIIKKMEGQLGHPVIVEFCVKLNKVSILQVRKQPSITYISDNERTLWRTDLDKYVPCEDVFFTDFGKRTLFMIYGERVLFSSSNVLRRIAQKHPDFDYGCAKFVLSALENEVKNGIYLKASVTATALKMSSLFNETGLLDLSDEPLSEVGISIYSRAHRLILDHRMTLANDLDAGSCFIETGSSSQEMENPTSRDLVHCIVSIAVFMIHECARLKDISNWRSGSAEMIDAHAKIIEKPMVGVDNQGSANRVIVEGCFAGDRVNIATFSEMNDTEKGRAVLQADFIPGFLIGESMKAKSIIVKWASDLSHISLSCKRSGVGLKVEN